MLKIVLLSTLAGAAANCYSQPSTAEIVHENGIVYGASYNPMTATADHIFEDQTLNVIYPRYTPGDQNRPIYVWVHGGGFDVAQGDNSADFSPEFCLQMARYGFVVFNVNYRRLHGYREQEHDDDQKYHHTTDYGAFRPLAVANDTRAAIRYAVLRTDLKTDLNSIVVGGDSAGAQSILMMAYMPLFQDEGNTGSNNVPNPTGGTPLNTFPGTPTSTYSLGRINTIVSMSGAMSYWGAHESMIGASLTLPKLVVIHGSLDPQFNIAKGQALVTAANTLAPNRGFMTEIVDGGHMPITPWIFSQRGGGMFSFQEWGYYDGRPLPEPCQRACGPTGTVLINYGDLLAGDMPGTRMTYWEHYMANLVTATGLVDRCGGEGKRRLNSDMFV